VWRRQIKLKIIKTSLDVLIDWNKIFPLPEISYSPDKKEIEEGEIKMYDNIRKAAAKAALQEYLEDVHSINVNKPFHCLNPAHEDRHPSMAFDRQHNRCICFSCGARYDIFDVVGIDYHLKSAAEKFRKTYQILGL
jgi:hypothetical protein